MDEKRGIAVSLSSLAMGKQDRRIVGSSILLYQFLGSCAAAGAGVMRPLMTVIFGNLVNQFNSPGGKSDMQAAINGQVLYLVYIFIGQWVMVCIYGVLFSVSAMKLSLKLRHLYMRAAVCQRVGDQVSANAASDLSSSIGDIEDAFAEKLGITVQAISTVVASLLIAFIQSWRLTVVLMVTIILLMGANVFLAALDARIEKRLKNVNTKASNHAEGSFEGIRAIVSSNAHSKITKIYAQILHHAKVLGFRKAPVLAAQYSTSFFVLLSAYGLAFWYGIKLLVQQEIPSGGKIVIVILSINQGTNAMREIVPIWGVLAKARASFQSLQKVIRTPPSLDPLDTGGRTFLEVKHDIELRDVSFAYPARPDVSVLDRFSIRIPGRKTTALVGPSGCGKSTIVALLERWFDPVQGLITVDAFNLNEFNVRSLRSNIGLVQQDSILFNDTIYFNVASGLCGTSLETMTDSQKRALVESCCQEAHAHDFIQSLPKGYDTVVGERGSLLSGGQRQRIAIARAIISSPSILIFDEATSALDARSEELVEAAIDRVSKDRTVILIAHKLSVVWRADQIYVISHGQVAETGTHDSLIEQGGTYARIYQEQNHTASDPQSSRIQGKVSDPDQPLHIHEDSQSSYGPRETTDVVEGCKREANVDVKPRTASLFSILRHILIANKSLRLPVIASLALCVLAGGVFPVQAVVFGNAVSVFSLPSSTITQAGNFWALMFFVLGLIAAAIYFVFGTITSLLGTLTTYQVRQEYFGSMIRQSIPFYERTTSTSLTAELSTHTAQVQSLLTILGSLGVSVVNLSSSTILALVVAWKPALVALFGSVPVIVFAGFLRVRTATTKGKSLSEPLIESAQYAAETIGMLRTVSALTMEQRVCEELDRRMHSAKPTFYKNIVRTMPLFAFSKSGSLLGMALNFWYGGRLLAQGEISSIQLWIVFMAIVAGSEAAAEFFASSNNIARAKSAGNAILRLGMTAESREDPADGELCEKYPFKSLETCNLNFRYESSNKLAIEDITATFEQGKHVAIVGPSGSGKSTIISLLARFYNPTSGEINLDDRALRDISFSAHSSSLGLISQETILFRGSVLENILLGVPADQATQERAQAAAQQAHIHDFILSLPEGYGTECGHKGRDFSGGQRQRLAIARALAKEPKLLLLDEPTSALDADSERAVMDALNEVRAQRIMVTVTHRLRTIKSADNIIVLVDGRVKELGTHDELMQLDGNYKAMWKVQQLDRQLE